MSNSGITRNVDTIISTLNKKADTNLANSAKAGEIEDIAKSASSAAQSAATVAHAASELINTALPQKVNKNGDTFNGSVVVDGDLTVSGQINATIKGSSETAMSATKDSSGNVIVDTYATKAQLNTTNTNVATNTTNITTAQNRADAAYTLANSKVSSNNGTMSFSLDDYSIDFRRAGDNGNYTVSLVTNKTLDNTKVYNTLIDKTGKFLPEFGTDLASNNATISLKNGDSTLSSVIVNNVANATSAASCTGNAATATKATQDSAGQQINTTYIKALSVSGKTITYTKGNGTTGTITTQDTTYTLPAATSSVLGGVKIGNNITISSGTISLSKSNVTTALGYTPPTTNTTYSNMTAATASAAGKSGLVPAPAAGKQASFLRGDGTWVVPTNTTYSTFTKATSSAAGKTGLVPAPAAGAQTKFLRGDATWQTIGASSAKAYVTETWSSGTSWYRKYSDGWIEQSGVYINTASSDGTQITISFHLAFSNTNYYFNRNTIYPGTSATPWDNSVDCGCEDKTTTTIKFRVGKTGNGSAYMWYACGF